MQAASGSVKFHREFILLHALPVASTVSYLRFTRLIKTPLFSQASLRAQIYRFTWVAGQRIDLERRPYYLPKLCTETIPPQRVIQSIILRTYIPPEAVFNFLARTRHRVELVHVYQFGFGVDISRLALQTTKFPAQLRLSVNNPHRLPQAGDARRRGGGSR